jgi:hypothetical protein
MRVVAVALACVATGCFSKPGFHDVAPDAPNDSPPEARLISKAYANSYNAMPHLASSAGMTMMTWEISTGDTHPNELVVFLANVDNGSDGVWLGLDTLGFTQLVQRFYNAGDGQTYVAAWKIATASEPTKYSGTFGQDISSAAATITLIGVTGYDAARVSPIGDEVDSVEPGTTGTMPSTATSPGVTTIEPDSLLIWATGSDWLPPGGGSNTFVAPNGFTSLVTLGDRGNDQFDWTSQQVAYHVQSEVGSTGPISGVLNGTKKGTPWNVLLVVPPARQL